MFVQRDHQVTGLINLLSLALRLLTIIEFVVNECHCAYYLSALRNHSSYFVCFLPDSTLPIVTKASEESDRLTNGCKLGASWNRILVIILG
jgi:hypothetical protein